MREGVTETDGAASELPSHYETMTNRMSRTGGVLVGTVRSTGNSFGSDRVDGTR